MTDVAIISLVLSALNFILLVATFVMSRRSEAGAQIAALEHSVERLERSLREELARNRDDERDAAQTLRVEMSTNLRTLGDSLLARFTELATLQRAQLDGVVQQNSQLAQTIERRLDANRQTLEDRLPQLSQEIQKQLDQMRATVDEKLQGTLEKRLGESFKHVSDRLEQVHRGLGEMQTLAIGVGDLKKILSNVKVRGGVGEYRLAAILEQILPPSLYSTNVQCNPNTRENVEFAIRLPGSGSTDQVWLPIDSKFPSEDYVRLVEAVERGDTTAAEEASRALENCIRLCARDIQGKYINPPQTTDFAILFLPTEGLYAELSRRVTLIEQLQRDYKVVIAGPTTFVALLNSLQMGFRTLAIQERSSDVWNLLANVKTEFGKFGDVMAAVKKKLNEASTKIDEVSVRSRAISRSLKKVETLGQSSEIEIIEQPGIDIDDEISGEALT